MKRFASFLLIFAIVFLVLLTPEPLLNEKIILKDPGLGDID
ncbi:hypothetical protein QGM71_13400 [Virgibacillus sp. C22-A2]|uniref:Uncharacterized protein n=1 Tax=Virgibacillus tibetensis TaxID=3042313 RepID=A0ABU6KH41_9BACI|nr:hypothetical protein [Virgibacillus sp. C22-A2]